MQREEGENAERRGRETERNGEKREKAETEMSKNKHCVIMFSILFNTCNCLYIDNMSSTSRLGLKPSKPTISL